MILDCSSTFNCGKWALKRSYHDWRVGRRQSQDRTQITRCSIIAILAGSSWLDDFESNPQQFIEQTAEVINRRKRLTLFDGVKYQKIGSLSMPKSYLLSTS